MILGHSKTIEDGQISEMKKSIATMEEFLIGLTFPQAFRNSENEIQNLLAELSIIKDFFNNPDTFDESKSKDLSENMMLEIISLVVKVGDGLVMCIEISACDEFDSEECSTNIIKGTIKTEKSIFTT